ncbi:GntR family transcriptional regulator [Devosia sp. WQ 349]|uniref:GntR family transcriptional regulator n=1 Tax=Devosia sp. WQ 349K1 TaxID=2800329 RepID=UPI001904D7D5|nr:GntR family transcriptional regulator [Devosia sp. WQ 349K1]
MQKNKAGKASSESLTQQAYHRISLDIRNCTLQPGSEVSEGEIADSLGMSKTPVREALGRLALEGFVKPLPRRGYQITPLTIDDLTELFEIRGILESAIVEDIIERISDEELDALEALAHASRDPAQVQTASDIINTNRAFHLALAKAHQNKRIFTIAEHHFDEMERYFHRGARLPELSRDLNEDHVAIVNALRKRDLKSVRSAIIEHNFETHNQVLSALAAPRLRRSMEDVAIRP